MCKIIAIINKNPANKNTINQLLKANSDLLGVENDGYSVLKHSPHTSPEALETTFYDKPSDYDSLYRNIKYRGEEIEIIHFRTSTGGGKGKDGLHLQKVQGWYFAHNGTVWNYYSIKDKSDSFYFTKYLLDLKLGLDKEVIEECIDDQNFSGKMFLYHPKRQDLVIFNNVEMYLYCLPECLIFSTFELEQRICRIESHNTLGLFWSRIKKIGRIKVNHRIKFNKTYFRFRNGELVKRELLNLPVNTTKTVYNYRHGYDD